MLVASQLDKPILAHRALPTAWNLRKIEVRMTELEGEIHRPSPRVLAAANELQALRD